MQLNTEPDEKEDSAVFHYSTNKGLGKLSLNRVENYKLWLDKQEQKSSTKTKQSKITFKAKVRNISLIKTRYKNSEYALKPILNILGDETYRVNNTKYKKIVKKTAKLSLKSNHDSTFELSKKVKPKKNLKSFKNSTKENNLRKLSLSNYPGLDKNINGVATNQSTPQFAIPEVNKNIKRKYDDIIVDINVNSDNENNQFLPSIDKTPKVLNMSVYDYHRPQQQMDTASNMVGITGNGGFNMSGAKPSYLDLTAEEDDPYNDLTGDRRNQHGNNMQYYHNTQLSMATLCNIGNTCYLNSVIYTLRFAPLFLHNLHHLIEDLNQINQKIGQNRVKSSSLGRNVGGLSGQNARSFSSKDLASLGNNLGCETPKSNRQIATEKLHELFQNLHRNEITENTEPFHADTFLHAIQAVSAIFEGNHQQDAHEFLMCILDSIRETCQSLTKIISDSPDIIVNGYVSVPEQSEITASPPAPLKTSFFSRKSKKKEEKSKLLKPPDSPLKENHTNSHDTTDSASSQSSKLFNSANDDEISSLASAITSGTAAAQTTNDNDKITEKIKKLGLDFFTEDFVGVTVSTTKCLTCETITEQKETMIDIAVPISGYENMEKVENPHLFFQNSCITKESFRAENKYRCEECFGYTEAIRSISFEILPRLLVIQLKRFSGGMEKINSYIPTPLQFDCFCVQCCNSSGDKKRHIYRLYSIITHVGATMSVGHYIAYTCSLDFYTEYLNCSKDKKNHLNRSQSNSGKHGDSGSGSSSEKNSGLMKKIKFVRSKASSSGDVTKNLKNLNLNGVMSKLTNGGSASSSNSAEKVATNAHLAANPTMCSGLSCCGIHAESILLRNNGHQIVNGGSLVNNDICDNINSVNNYNLDSQQHHNHFNQQYSATINRAGEPTWYMCDDDKIKSMSQTEFEELLSPNNKATITPYLLFYARINNTD